MKAKTNLQTILSKGEFAITCGYHPPSGIDVDAILKNVADLKGKIHALHVSDNSTAQVRMASWALSKLFLDADIEPVLEMGTRDRNRIALQSDLLGASALGIANVLCRTGNHTSTGDHPQAKKVFDIDAVQWISAVKQIRDDRVLMNGTSITGDPAFFIGTTANPFAASLELHLLVLGKKIAAGADFIQTQPVLDMESFKAWFKPAQKEGLTKKCPVIAGVIALKSATMARHLQQNVPDIMIPDAIIDRLDGVDEAGQLEEGINICIENIQALKKTKGISGVHILAPGCEDQIPNILEKSGL